MKAKRVKTNNKKYILVPLIILLITLLSYLFYNFYINIRDKKLSENLQNGLTNCISTNEINNDMHNELIEKVKELQNENEDIKAWIKINDTNVNYPVVQASDNNYYLYRNYKKENSNYGSIFIDSNSNIENPNSNIIMYGHNMKDGSMFKDLLKYADEEYYNNHKYIEFVTNTSSSTYEIIAVFKSRIFYKNEKNVFRYYQCTNLNNEQDYNYYVNNCKELSLYDTGVNAEYGEQIITLITCEYSSENGRMVVVAKKKE